MNEIGGDFCLADIDHAMPEDEQSYACLVAEWQSQAVVYGHSSGRAAYHAALKQVLSQASTRPKALLPSYLCDTMLEPFRAAGLEVDFYRVYGDLSTDVDDLDQRVQVEPSVVMLCDYFGFHQSLGALSVQCVSLSDEHFVIYDATHSALDGCPWGSLTRKPDVCLISLRKMMPVVDGALTVWLRGCETLDTGRPTALGKSASTRALAMLLKASYLLDGQGDKQTYLSMYEQSERLISEEYHQLQGMSQLSWSILRRVGVRRARRRRRENYLRLLESLRDLPGMQPLYSCLPNDVYPLGFPIVSEHRDALRAYLVQNQIYCPVHWRLPRDIEQRGFSESHWLSQRILTIPCDQRYTSTDMARVAAVIAGFRQQ